MIKYVYFNKASNTEETISLDNLELVIKLSKHDAKSKKYRPIKATKLDGTEIFNWHYLK